jgi:hypothetical protein
LLARVLGSIFQAAIVSYKEMPYELSFTKSVPIADPAEYINDCCIGGDVVVNQLLPEVRARYTDIQSNEEDWGWFIWFRRGKVHMAIDVFTDNPEDGSFRIHLTSRVKRFFRMGAAVDTPELDELREWVAGQLTAWGAGNVSVTRLDRNYY